MTGPGRRRAAPPLRIDSTDPRDPDARYCLRAYFRELAARFDSGFDPGRSISASDAEMTPPRGLFLLARLHGSPVGCGALKFHPETQIAEVKRMWLAPDLRGLGLGRRMLDRLAAEAAASGARELRLETNHALAEARHLYESAGFAEVVPFNDEPYAHHWYQRSLRPGAPDAPERPASG